VLLPDETFAHLDDHSAAQISQWICDWSSSKVIVLAHHGSPPVAVEEVVEALLGD
jgi:ABC-type bacteriocin/lantibiotic exporter with double-glycine peptidase domain